VEPEELARKRAARTVHGFRTHKEEALIRLLTQEEVAGQVKHKSLREIRRDIELSYQEE
jgi:hypothetical protein